MKTNHRVALCSVVSMLLAACGGSGGGPGPAAPSSSLAEEKVVSGYEFLQGGYTDTGGGGAGGGGAGGGGGGAGAGGSDGRFRNAVVDVYKLDTGTPVLLGSAVVGANDGMVTIFPGTYGGPVLIKIRGQAGAQYFDEAVGALVPFDAGEELHALLPSIASTTNGSASTRNYGVTALTEAAYRYALANFGPGGLADPTKINQANEAVRVAINAQLDATVRIEDITRLPVLIGPDTARNSVQDTKNGRYTLVASGLNLAAKEFNPQLARPGRSITTQLAADLTDGAIDEKDRSGGPVAQAGQAAYSAPAFSNALTRGISNLSQLYATPELNRIVVLNQNAVGIKLTWGAQPADLDAHLLGPQPSDHVWFSSQGSLATAPFTSLDVDDTDGAGPELVRIARVAKGRTYRYYVENFDRVVAGITNSPARVEVTLNGSTQTLSFAPPPGENGNFWWSVFDLVVGNDCSVRVQPIQAWSATAPTAPSAASATPLEFCP